MKQIIQKIMSFKDVFKDTNDYNEKTIIGFLSFAVMVLVMVADVVSGAMGNDLVINEFTTTLPNSDSWVIRHRRFGEIWQK